MSISERLKKLRHEHHYTQEDVARKCNIALITYARYESGSRQPKKNIAQKLCDLYGITLDDLYDDHQSDFSKISDEELLFALFGKDAECISSEDFEQVKDFAKYIVLKKRGQLG